MVKEVAMIRQHHHDNVNVSTFKMDEELSTRIMLANTSAIQTRESPQGNTPASSALCHRRRDCENRIGSTVSFRSIILLKNRSNGRRRDNIILLTV